MSILSILVIILYTFWKIKSTSAVNVYIFLTQTFDIDAELTADLVGDYLFTDADFINHLCAQNRNLFQKLFDEIKYLCKIVTGSKEQRQLEKVKKLFEKALNENKGDATNIESQERVGLTYSLNKSFYSEYDAWNKIDPRKVFTVGKTSEILKSVGVKDSEIKWDSSKIIKIKAKHSEMTDAIIKQVPSILENPIVIFKSLQKDSRITLFGEVFADGKPILAVLELNPTGRNGTSLDEIKIASSYGKDNAQSLINRAAVLYVDENKKRVSEWEKRTGLQLPVGSSITNSNNSISNSSENVNNNNLELSKNEDIAPVGQALNENGAAQKNTTDGDVQMSISKIVGVSGKNYGVGVHLDSDLLEGLTDSERKQMVRLRVVEELAGNHFIAYDSHSNPVDIMLAERNDKIHTKSGKTKPVLKELYNKNIFNEVKQEAVVLADELIQTASYDKSVPAKHKHEWLDNNGLNLWDEWTTYIQDKNNTVWRATLNIANDTNGRKILYDIDPIKKVEGASKSAPTSTNNKIPQKAAVVNTHSIQNAGSYSQNPNSNVDGDYHIRGEEVALDNGDIGPVREDVGNELLSSADGTVADDADVAANGADVVELSHDNVLSERIGGLRGTEKYRIIQDYIYELLGDNRIVFSDGKRAVVDKSDTRHIASNSADKKTAQISKIQELIAKAQLYAEDNEVTHKKFDYFCYYKADVKYEEDTFPIYLNVGRAKNDGVYHLYDITQTIRDTADRINGLERPKPNEGYALRNGVSTYSISDDEAIVNDNVTPNNDIAPDAGTFSGGTATAVMDDIGPVREDLDRQSTGANIDISEQREYNINEQEGGSYAYTDEFRRVQEESAKITADTEEMYHSGYRTLDEGIRERFSRGVRSLFLDARNNVTGNDNGVLRLDDIKSRNSFYIHQDVNGNVFHDVFEIARHYLKYGELVDLHDVKTTENGIGYDDCYNYLSDDGLSGFSITPEGDLISVFNASGKRGFLRAIAPVIKRNAKTLDCYASNNQNLQSIYSAIFGFKAASTMDYNLEYDHDNIAENHGMPPIAFMVNTNADVETRHFTKEQYDEAVAYRNSFINNTSSADIAPIGDNVQLSASNSALMDAPIREDIVADTGVSSGHTATGDGKQRQWVTTSTLCVDGQIDAARQFEVSPVNHKETPQTFP